MCKQLVLLALFIFCGRSTLGAMNYGYCPDDENYGTVKQIRCNTDQVCKKDERCCQVGDTVQCVKSVSYLANLWSIKKGKCPKLDVVVKMQGTACRADQDCKEKELCCAAKCIAPVPIQPTANSGYCPPHSPVEVVNATCKHDHECGGFKKCCQVNTESQCVSALFEKGNHGGYCPEVKEDLNLKGAKLCNGDSDCFGKLKCCPTSTAFRCQAPENRKPPPKQGRCEDIPEKKYIVMQRGCMDDYDCVGKQKCCFKEDADASTCDYSSCSCK